MSDELLRLAERCEELPGSSEAVDIEITAALSLNRGFHCVLRYSASVDAALTLVPEGAGLDIMRYWIGGHQGPVWSAKIGTGGVPENPRREYGSYDAENAALAITAAALRARAYANKEKA